MAALGGAANDRSRREMTAGANLRAGAGVQHGMRSRQFTILLVLDPQD
jgi:hypothetical protein